MSAACAMRQGPGRRRATATRPADADGGAGQSGVALITVLLVVALATVAAVHMTRQTQLDLHRTGNRLALVQAHEIALGGEHWAVSVLARVRRAEDYDGVDARDQMWAQLPPPMQVEGGYVTGAIQDMQGRFNVNSLVPSGDSIDALALERFERLLETLGIDPRVSQAVTDWMDDNRETTYPAGGEDDYYLTLDPPYLAANRALTTASELRLLRGIDADAWRRLAPHVSALPGPTAINVNTATPAVLQAIVPGLARSGAETLAAETREEPFDSVAAFLEHPLVARPDSGQEVESAGLGVGSSHFRVRIDVRTGSLDYTLYSWLQREADGASRVLRRSRTGG
ncbi:MAG: type II secretion system minor pseudopilin GspK [Halofilum sp. (in: g-proteobacteria)]|nr:type II secretion system minor pseudopilin GspK [Halofilum sp. (in: g-proteobacteria)]